MTDEKYTAGEIRDRTTDDGSPHARDRWTNLLVHRWPTALGVAVAALTALDLKVDAGFVSSLSALVVVMALVYVGAAALGRPRASWVVLLAGLPVAFFVPPTSAINPSVVILAVAALFLVVGVMRGRLREPVGLPLDRVGRPLRGPCARRLPRGPGPPRSRRLGRLPLSQGQGGHAFVRGVLRDSGPLARRGHPLHGVALVDRGDTRCGRIRRIRR
jgi:hypothetical protein